MEFVRGSNRELLPAAVAADLRRAGALIEDHRRERPRWFDGRFLAARDLVREQQYFLTREADLGRAAGSGVATGLDVTVGSSSQTLRIGAGHGITPSGELVLLERSLTVDLADLPRAEGLSGKFGLGRIPVPPLRSRTGLFALGLRPVEFTANPVGAYPTSITGQRTVEDGDVVEATAVVLVPWPDDGSADTLDVRRGRAARAVFVEGDDRGLAADVLPLCMLALSDNAVAWIDVPMLRRELGADRADLPGLGLAPRALRFAHLLQHQGHVADVIAANGGRSFPAAAVFPALPPAGPLPPGVIDPGDFTQRYFPAEVDVDFAIIPEDELPALVEEALALPAFDLTAADEALDSSSVLVLAPVPREEWRSVLARLETLTRAVRPAAPNRVAARKPLEILQLLRVPTPAAAPLGPDESVGCGMAAAGPARQPLVRASAEPRLPRGSDGNGQAPGGTGGGAQLGPAERARRLGPAHPPRRDARARDTRRAHRDHQPPREPAHRRLADADGGHVGRAVTGRQGRPRGRAPDHLGAHRAERGRRADAPRRRRGGGQPGGDRADRERSRVAHPGPGGAPGLHRRAADHHRAVDHRDDPDPGRYDASQGRRLRRPR